MKNNIDVIIISWAKDNYLKFITQRGIESLLESEDTEKVQFNIYVVESNKKVNWDNFPNTKTIYTDLPFGYHRYLNLGINASNSPYVVLCNSDLTFEKNWASEIIEEMEKDPNLLSASPLCPQLFKDPNIKNQKLYYGYGVRQHIAGWCIFQQRKIYDQIQLDEDFEFWYCDNSYAMDLYLNKIKHALVSTSVVNHHDKNLGETGINAITPQQQQRYTTGQTEIFQRKYGKYM